MDGYVLVKLNEMLQELGEDRVRTILSSFSCPLNSDVEYFLCRRAIEFAKQKIAPTTLVFCSYKEQLELVGYFTLTIKDFCVYKNRMSGALRRKISKYGVLDRERDAYMIPAPLIAQLGKNYTGNLNKLITGDELLKMAVDRVALIQQDIGGKVVYIECENKPKLLEFYDRNGFCIFGKRLLDRDEKERMTGNELIQMLKVIT